MENKLKLDLDSLAEGEVQERISHELEKIAKNIMDTMTESTKKRSLTVQVEFVPNEGRTALETSVLVKSSLAPQKRAYTTTLIGRDFDTGFIQMQELKSGAPGQTFIDPVNGSLKTDTGEIIDNDGKVIDFKKTKTN